MPSGDQPHFATSARARIAGRPDPQRICTSYAERTNLSIRMGTRRLTRPTNAFSEKTENHANAMAIYFMHYNFVRLRQTLRCSPAMAAGVTAKLWDLNDMAKVLEAWKVAQKLPPRGRPLYEDSKSPNMRPDSAFG